MRGQDRRKFIIGGLIYLALLLLIIVFSYRWTKGSGGNWDDFAKLAGVWATFLTALATASVSLFVVTKQTDAAKELESLRKDYAKEVGKEIELHKAELAKEVAKEIEPFRAQLSSQVSREIEVLRNGFNKDLEELRHSLTKETEILKSNLAANLEFLKGRFGAERKAYEELYSAAFIYYQTLASLEVGMCDETRIKKAEDGMLAAGRYTIPLTDAHKSLWFKIWQRARKIAELAVKNLKEQQNSQDELIKMWRDKAPDFAKYLNEFEEIASSKHEIPPY